MIIGSLFPSCDNNLYYKTFDYKTMSCKNPTDKSDYSVKLLTATKNKIELEVFFDSNTIKRTFIKKKNYWYSNVKYEDNSIPGTGVAYGGKFESEYYIFKDHIVFNYDHFLFYVDLVTNKIYYFTRIKNFNIHNYIYVNIEDLMSHNEYNIVEYNVYYDRLYERTIYYGAGGKLIDDGTEISSYDKDLNIFFLLDVDLYSYLAGRKFIYD